MIPKISICLTVHNKAYLLERVLKGIFDNCTMKFELCVMFDDCSDKSESIYYNFIESQPKKKFTHKEFSSFEPLFETKANNKLLKASTGEYCCIVQDDQIITERSWDLRMLEPFEAFDDIFAVSARMAHSWKPNLNPVESTTGWNSLIMHCDHADKNNTPRNVFAIRDSCNRSPLMIKREDLVQINYLDEIYYPLTHDEHDLMFRAKRDLGKVCGFYDIGWESKPEYGGTRDENGNTKEWVYAADRKNAKIFYERHGINFLMTHENRIINGKNS